MNLGRAKTILIVAFLGLNLFLGYHLYGPYVGVFSRNVITPSELQQALSYLSLHNYRLEAEIDRTAQRRAFLTVAVAQEMIDHAIAYYGGEDAALEEEGRLVYGINGRILSVFPNGQLRAEFLPGLDVIPDNASPDDQELSRLVQQALQDLFPWPDQARFDRLIRDDAGGVILYYYQLYGEIPLFSGNLHVMMERDRIIRVEVYWLEPVELPREGNMEVIPATDALVQLVDQLEPAVQIRIVKKVDLGYYSREYDADLWEIPPVWRIVMDDGQIYYVNAFTGNLEADR